MKYHQINFIIVGMSLYDQMIPNYTKPGFILDIQYHVTQRRQRNFQRGLTNLMNLL